MVVAHIGGLDNKRLTARTFLRFVEDATNEETTLRDQITLNFTIALYAKGVRHFIVSDIPMTPKIPKVGKRMNWFVKQMGAAGFESLLSEAGLHPECPLDDLARK